MKYRLFSDPGHSWLEVDFNELVELGINKKITAWSYHKGNNVYLVVVLLWCAVRPKSLSSNDLGRRRQGGVPKSLCGNDLQRFGFFLILGGDYPLTLTISIV